MSNLDLIYDIALGSGAHLKKTHCLQSWLKESSPKNKYSVLIYSPSSCSLSVYISCNQTILGHHCRKKGQ